MLATLATLEKLSETWMIFQRATKIEKLELRVALSILTL